jgi:hypothetical protein
MESQTMANPLAKHFRQPILYVRLPSEGRWWPKDAVEMPITGEIPVYAMTARDEITMKTPDALMNGASTVHTIESCCPNIKNAWQMPSVDLDKLLLAMRIATYGNELEFTSLCPHCSTKFERVLDLSVIIDRIQLADWDTPVQVNGLSIRLRPQSYEDYNKNNLVNFEEQRMLRMINDQELSDEEKKRQFDDLFQKLIASGITQIARSIESITMEDGTVVTEYQYISEFLDNCDRAIWDQIKTKLDSIRDQNDYNNVTATCENEACGQEFTVPFRFEQTNFFE